MTQTVLVVDDDFAMRTTMARLLAFEGYRVLTADSFEAGRSALDNCVPDVLIVDVRLGAFNGLQLVATANGAIPSIVMTGHDDVTIKRAAYRFGADYFVKPIPSAELLAAVRRHMSPSHTSQVAADLPEIR